MYRAVECTLVMVLCFLVANTSHDSNVITSEFIMPEWCLGDIYMSGKPTQVVFFFKKKSPFNVIFHYFTSNVMDRY